MRRCPYCDGTGKFLFKFDTRIFIRCSQCDLIFKETPVHSREIIDYYRKDFFNDYASDQIGGSRSKLFDHILDIIEENIQLGTLLDIGAGCGFFLLAAKKRGWEIKGIEPSRQSVEVARNNHGLDIFFGTLPEYRLHSKYDVITFINVLDHSYTPWAEIGRASKLLRPGGLIYLRFPNGFLHTGAYLVSRKFSLSASMAKFLVFHEYSFTPNFILQLLDDHGFVETVILNSPPSQGDPYKLFASAALANRLKKIIYAITKFVEISSCRHLYLGSSLEVISNFAGTRPV